MKTEQGFYKFDIQMFAGTAFVVNDKLPATTQLKIAWTEGMSSGWYISPNGILNIIVLYTSNNFISSIFDMAYPIQRVRINEVTVFDLGDVSACGDANNQSCSTYKYVVIDTSGWTESQRTITTVHATAATVGLTYEDLNLTPVVPEIGQKIKIFGSKIRFNTILGKIFFGISDFVITQENTILTIDTIDTSIIEQNSSILTIG